MMKDIAFKIIVVGDQGAGKTSLVQRFAKNQFTENYKATIGVDFLLKILQWNSDTKVILQLWDIAGQERFGAMTRVFYREAKGAVVVFDISKKETSLSSAQKWKEDIDDKVNYKEQPIPVLLLANKCDLNSIDTQTQEELDQFCKDHKFIGWRATSAKTGHGVQPSFQILVEKMISSYDPEYILPPNKPNQIPLDQRNKNQPNNNGGCC